MKGLVNTEVIPVDTLASKNDHVPYYDRQVAFEK
jgi:hypothetical protein